MIVNFLTKRLTQKQRNDFVEVCETYVNNNVVVTVEDSIFQNFFISMSNFGNDNSCYHFIMHEPDFDFIVYSFRKLLEAGSQICCLHDTIAQLEK